MTDSNERERSPDREAEALDDETWDDLNWQVSRVFTPAVPVSEADLFAGRSAQVNRVIDAINQPGQHVIVYGERGVGKTSLANVLSSRLVSKAGRRALAPRVNCDATDTFGSLWAKVFAQVGTVVQERAPGFKEATRDRVQSALDTFTSRTDVTPDDVRLLLTRLGKGRVLLVILDEFDRLVDGEARRAVADTIKMLSDHAVPGTLVVVGVADTVAELIEEHQSIERALVQVLMPRMEPGELHEILERGTRKLGMTIDAGAKREIAALSQGLPNYTHGLALYAARVAFAARRLNIRRSDVKAAIERAVASTRQSLQDDYRKAVTSPQTGNLYGRVLLACARAKTDGFGYFAAADVRKPMSSIMGKKYDIPSFARHLNDFCDPARGRVLRKEGTKRKYRYRFTNPLMQPLVLMKGIVDGFAENGRS